VSRRLLTITLVLAAFFLLPVEPAGAQRWQFDVGGNAVAYDSSERVNAASVAPLLEWNQGGFFARVGGAFVVFEGGQSILQGQSDFSWLSAPVGTASPFHTEVLGSLDGSTHSGGFRTAAMRGELRLHVAGGAAGLWLGLAGAGGWNSSSTSTASTVGPSLGAWARHHAWNLTILGMPFRHDGFWFPEVQGYLSTALGPVDLTGNVGWRGTPRGSGMPAVTWAGGSLAFWLTAQSALVLGAGIYPPDLLQAFPKGNYLSASIRFSRRRPSSLGSPASGPSLYVQRRGPSELMFRVLGASRVDLVGDWTGWQPVPLKRRPDGRWAVAVDLAPGVHRFNLVVDGKRWIVPEDRASVDDGFGGKVSILIVPE
jgi:hypothetical protein